MRNSQSQLPPGLEADQQMIMETSEASAKRHKNQLGRVTVTPDISPPVAVNTARDAYGSLVISRGGADPAPATATPTPVATAAAATAQPLTNVHAMDFSSLSQIECWDMAAKLISNAGSGQGGSDALETSVRIRAIGTTIQAIGLEARSALSDLLPEIPRGYHEILVSLKTLEEKWMALSRVGKGK